MSTTNEDGGGWGWLLLIIVLVALAWTKPTEATHRAAIAERTPILRALFGVQELVGGAELKYHDYFFFSIMTAKFDKTAGGVPVSIGLFGKVFYGKDK